MMRRLDAFLLILTPFSECVLLTLNCDADEDLISPASDTQKEKIDFEILLEVMLYVL